MIARWIILFILGVANCFYGFGAFLSIGGPWVVQDMIQDARCAPPPSNITIENDNTSSFLSLTYAESTVDNVSTSTECCATCLGYSNVEYNMYTAIAFWTSLPLVLTAGYLLDRFGAPCCALSCASMAVIGCIIRVGSTLVGGQHYLSFGLMILGEIAVSWSFNMSVVIRNYIAGRYFSVRVRPISTSCSYSLSMSAFIVVFYTVSPFGHKHGLPSTFGIITAAAVLSLTGAAIIWICDWKLKQLQGVSSPSKKDESMEETEKMTDEPPCTDNVRAEVQPKTNFFNKLKTVCSVHLPLLIIAGGATHGDLSPFTANSIVFLKESYGVIAETASIYVGVLYSLIVVLSPIVGLAVGRLGYHEVAITVGGSLSTVGFLVLNFARSLHPLISIIIYAVGEAMSNYNVPALASHLVATEHLGTAMAIVCFNINLTIGVVSALTGIFVQFLPTRATGWTVALGTYAFISSTMALSGFGLLLIRVCRRRTPPVLKILDNESDAENDKESNI